jgi:flagella basal body P-ring formation protein FlgA
MQRALIWLVSVVVLAWTVSAHAALPSLKGTYAFTGTLSCLFAPGSDSAPPNPPGTMLPNFGRLRYVLLAGAIERGDKIPKSDIRVAEQRLGHLQRDPTHAVPHRFDN